MSNQGGLELPSVVDTVAPPVVVTTWRSLLTQDEPFQCSKRMSLLVSWTAIRMSLVRLSPNWPPYGAKVTQAGVPVKVVVPSVKVMSFWPLVGWQLLTGPQLVPSQMQ